MATGTGPLSDQTVKSKGKKRDKHREHDDSHGVTMGTSESGEKFTFFFGHETPFSQWYPAEFVVDGQKYSCAEQYMMHQKAGEGMCLDVHAHTLFIHPLSVLAC